ncbi:hypothetical protein [Rhodanobacter spathiphylli]|uniref:Uncharacterized protein n=1 Tax=Rhodanobacter spathiphylli B39 TaxID=1163407 RepID=I4W4X1_9GAMM|nr:hypothetical protein [Rhodanobacter spathiphylli]EIL94512.1 hypothetical protein UU7_04487 [Rhodanobacter spathiphylli B39]
MSAVRRSLVDRSQPPQRDGHGLPHGSLRHDCVLYFRDLAVATIIFVPFWSLLHLLRVSGSH